jgi:REP element-mobilizing transposase RayT
MDFLAYCLMPNHFHFLIQTKKEYQAEEATNAFRVLLSSYTRAINKQEDRTGSLFQQNAKAKSLEDAADYHFICFHYIHQNPMRARLVPRMEDWEFSSFRDYIGLRNGTLCNQALAKELIDLPHKKDALYKESYQVIPHQQLDFIF